MKKQKDRMLVIFFQAMRGEWSSAKNLNEITNENSKVDKTISTRIHLCFKQ